MPEAAKPGVHLTLDLGGRPNLGQMLRWVDSADDLVVDPRRGDAFYAEVRKYWPALPDGALIPAMRASGLKFMAPESLRLISVSRTLKTMASRAW